MTVYHLPVLADAVTRFLVRPGIRVLVDATVGAGGHAERILESHSEVVVVGLDRDPRALKIAGARLARFGGRVRLIHTKFSDLIDALAGVGKVDGVLLDLGVSSMQLDEADRGFSYRGSGPLDMRMSGDGPGAKTLIDQLDAGALSRTLRGYGGVRRPSRIARSIVRARDDGRMQTTSDLRAAIARGMGGREDPAEFSRVFQALRIRVNSEVEELDDVLRSTLSVVRRGGRVVAISYHSLEDRAVKNFFRAESTACVCPPKVPVCACGHTASLGLLTRRAVMADDGEVARNPRARSARLRAAEVLQ